MDRETVASVLRKHGVDAEPDFDAMPVGGGDISAAWRIRSRHGPVFLKTGDAKAFDMFEAEAAGLRELAAAEAVRVPEVLAVAEFPDGAVLALEWLQLERASGRSEQLLGTQLAQLHRTTDESFGWHRDNTLGRTPQPNNRSSDWLAFFRERRLGFQLDLAAGKGYVGELQVLGSELLALLPRFFEGHSPVASLLHGDLWGGNWAVANGRPVIFDPAVYYGDRETDLAMTRLFGGFGADFYRAYQEAWPLHNEHRKRRELYQLYHVLNHLNLFGGGYRAQAIAMMKQLLG